MKPKPKTKREGKKHDSGKKLVAAIQGNHETLPTAFAELLTGFVQLGVRLPKADLPYAAKLHSFEIQQATDTELPTRIEAIGRDLGIILQKTKPENLPDLLRKTAAVIECRPIQPHREGTKHMVLNPADSITVAGHLTAWRNAVKKLPAQRIITKAEMIEHLETMPPKDRNEEIKKLTGLTPDEEGRTNRRKLTRLFAELRLPPGRGRQKKPDK